METGLVAIEIAARIHSVPMDVQSVRKKYFVERELSPEEMIRILRDHGFKANVDPRRRTSGWHRPQGILLAGTNPRRLERLAEPGCSGGRCSPWPGSSGCTGGCW